MKKRLHRPRVVLNMPEHVPDLIKAFRATLTGVKQNASTFPGSTAIVDKAEQDLDQLDVLETATRTGTHGAADARDQQLIVVKGDTEQVKGLVQTAINASPAQAETIAAQAALHLHKATTRRARVLVVREGKVPGSIEVVWPAAGKRAAYNAQYSLDGGKTWSDPITTDLTRATFAGLPIGTTVLVRTRATVKGVTGAWSEPVSFVVR